MKNIDTSFNEKLLNVALEITAECKFVEFTSLRTIVVRLNCKQIFQVLYRKGFKSFYKSSIIMTMEYLVFNGRYLMFILLLFNFSHIPLLVTILSPTTFRPVSITCMLHFINRSQLDNKNCSVQNKYTTVMSVHIVLQTCRESP